MLKIKFHLFRTYRFSLLIASLLLLLSCAAPLPPVDLERAKQLRNEGLKFELNHDFAAAIAPYREATRYDPENSSGYLKLAEFQEAIQRPQAAYDTYDRALSYLPASDPEREAIHYRSALLLAEKLDDADSTQKHLEKIHNPIFQNDLAGVIALHRNEARQALKYFQTALKYGAEYDQSARIYFHVAQAYDQLGDEDRSRKALLIAVPKATSRDLKEDIKRFFESMLTR